MTDWWWGVPVVDHVAMPCSAGGHWAQWANGGLRLPEVDAEAEDVLAALGGSACRCGDIERAWTAHRSDLRVLTLAARTAHDRALLNTEALRALEDDRLPSFERWAAHRRGRAQADGNGEDAGHERWRSTFSLLLLLALPNVLQRRLVATVGHEVERGWNALDPVERAVVTAAITGRLAPYLRASLVGSGVIDRNQAPIVDVRVGDPGASTAVAATSTPAGLRAKVTVGADWLRSVWGRDVPLRGDTFVLEVTETAQDAVLRGRAVTWRRSSGNSRVEAVVEEWENDGSPQGEPPS